MTPVVAAITRPEDLFPAAWFSVESCVVDDVHNRLHPLEDALVAHAAPARRAEFAAGRHAARRALARLGVACDALLRDRARCPSWPAGTCGSISHSGGRAIGVAAHSTRVRAIGVDLQHIDAAAARAVEASVCDSAERAALARQAPVARTLHALALFSAKEAIYKCLYAATGARLGFHDARVEPDLATGLFRARLRRAHGTPPRTQLVGRVGCDAGHVFSGLYWLQPGPAFQE